MTISTDSGRKWHRTLTNVYDGRPVCVHTCACVHMHVCMCAHACMCACACMHACMRVCVCMRACVRVCVDTHASTIKAMKQEQSNLPKRPPDSTVSMITYYMPRYPLEQQMHTLVDISTTDDDGHICRLLKYND